MTDCTRIDQNKEKCSCPKVDCMNHGKCCLCVINHRTNNGYPACLRYE